jgi:hypothetical protein
MATFYRVGETLDGDSAGALCRVVLYHEQGGMGKREELWSIH